MRIDITNDKLKTQADDDQADQTGDQLTEADQTSDQLTEADRRV